MKCIKTLLFSGLLCTSALVGRAGTGHTDDDQFWRDAAMLLPPGNLEGGNPDPSAANQLGQWSPVKSWPHIPVSAAILPNGLLLTYSGQEVKNWPGTATRTRWGTYNTTTDQFSTDTYHDHEMFCAALVMRTDGILQTTGGRYTIEHSSLYDWRTNTWSRAQDMFGDRWYNTSLAMPDGNILAFSGQGSPTEVEEYDHLANSWRILGGLNWTPGSTENNWPHLMLAPNGKIFHFGPTDVMHWVDPTGNGSMQSTALTVPGTVNPAESSFCMYDIGKVLAFGGYQSPTIKDASDQAFTVNFNVDPPQLDVIPGGMVEPRQFATTVVLPNGEVVIMGGNRLGKKFTDVGTMALCEMWDPGTRQFRAIASLTVPRGYHSTGLLLPDGRVFCGGSGYGGGGTEPWNKDSAEFFTPPILFNSDGTLKARPSISTAPATVSCGTVFDVAATPGLRQFAAIRLQATTHAMNTDQRRITLPFSETSSGQYQVIAHPNPNVMVPGYWMLFAVADDGAYSEAKIFHVDETVQTSASLAVDDVHELYIDGQLVGIGTNPAKVYHAALVSSGSTIAIRACNTGGGQFVLGDFTLGGEQAVTNSDWKVSTTAPAGWNQPGFDDSGWANATEYGGIPGNVTGMPQGSAARNIWSSNTNDDEIFLRFTIGATELDPIADQTHYIGDSVNLQPQASGGDGNYTFSEAGLPDGLSIHPTTGLISGTPTNAALGISTVTITVTDGIGTFDQQTFDWLILGEKLAEESFDADAGAFTYSDDTFRGTSQPSYASGSFSATGGVSNSGALQVFVGGIDGNDILNMSGGWQYQFSLAQPKDVRLSFQFNLNMSDPYEADEIAEALLSVDGALTGLGGNDYLAQLNGGGATSSGWQSVDLDLGTLSAGSHTIVIGAYNTKKTTADEESNILIDNFLLSSASLPNSAPSIAPVADQTHTIGETISFQVNASDPENDPLTYSATGLPDGLGINPVSGLISGTLQSTATFTPTVTVTDTGSLNDSAGFTWTVNASLQLTAGTSGPIAAGASTSFTASATGRHQRGVCVELW